MSKSEQTARIDPWAGFTEKAVRSLAAHPYLWTFALCIFIHPFILGAEENLPPNATLLETLMMLAGGFGAVYYLYKSEMLGKTEAVLGCAGWTIAIGLGVRYYSGLRTKGVMMLFCGFIIVIAAYALLRGGRRYRTQLNSFLILGLSFMLKLYYVFMSSCYTRQHDVHAFGGESGHAGYMEYLLFNHKLPDFDVRTVWQYCHPPLHHFICAVWIHLNEDIFGIGRNPARESLQTLTLFYSMCIVITAYRILRQFKLEGIALYVPVIIIAFHPAFIMFSGSINNDVLSVAFMMGAFLCTVRWYREQRFIDLMKIALCVGLGMMTKLAAALVAPPIAVVFLIVFIKRAKSEGGLTALKMVGQFAAFGAVCAPLGLWFEIRNYIRYRVPITYVQEMPKNSLQYLGNMEFSKRITDFGSAQFESPFEQWLRNNDGVYSGYNEYNPLIALLKNSLFGEYINEQNWGISVMPNGMTLCRMFFWLGALIAALCLLLMIFDLVTKCGLTPTEKTFFACFYVVLMGNFYKMAKDYPFTCTMNFRYITPTVIIGAFFLGVSLRRIPENNNNKGLLAVRIAAVSAAILFALLSIMIFVFVCLPKPPEA